jgi:hypothetical protein
MSREKTTPPKDMLFVIFWGRTYGGDADDPDDVRWGGYRVSETWQELQDDWQACLNRNSDRERYARGMIPVPTLQNPAVVTEDSIKQAKVRLRSFEANAKPQLNAKQKERERRADERADYDVL